MNERTNVHAWCIYNWTDDGTDERKDEQTKEFIEP